MPKSCLTVFIAALMVSLTAAGARAQEAGATAYVPDDAVFAMRTSPAKALVAPGSEFMPIEVIQAAGKQNFGVDPMTILELKVVSGLPQGPAAPPVGILMRLQEDFDPTNINPNFLVQPDAKQVAGHEVFVVGTERDSMYLHVADPKTVLLTSAEAFQAVVAAKAGGNGPLAKLIAANPLGDNDTQVIVAIEPLRPMIAEAIAGELDNVPPELRELAKLPELMQAVIFQSAQQEEKSQLRLEMVCNDATAATQALQILEQSVETARVMAIAAMTSEIQGEGRMPEAQRAYLTRIANYVAKLIQFEQANDKIVVEAEVTISVASAGVLVGLLLPAVQAAREAARRMSASNNMKQIGLAFHNYHAAYKKLPPPAIVDDNGKKLLSWRVAILPFIEQQALYEEFHLDEPWDSDHNIKLLDRMPEVYVEPSLPLPPGMTVFHALVGDGLMMEHDQDNKFRNVLDGLSNTLMAVEVDSSEAVQWTKPQDVEVDFDNPIPQMGRAHVGGFHVLMGDGAVIFITHSIDLGLFQALLTRNGGEPIEEQLNH